MTFLRSALLACLIAAPAAAQKPPTKPAASPAKPQAARQLFYEDALVCYGYYSVFHEVARQAEKGELTNADSAAGYELAALEARDLQVMWRMRLQETAGKRTPDQIETDLKRIGAPVVADAKAALAGDKTAAARGAKRGLSCAAYATAPAAKP